MLVDPAENTRTFMLDGLEHQARELLEVPVTVLTAEFLPIKFRNEVLQQAQPL